MSLPRRIALVVLALPLLLGGCVRIAGTNAATLLALFQKGHETRLRKPLRPIGERFCFGEPERSERGSPSAQDSRVPLLVARQGRDGAAIRSLVRASLGDEPSRLDFTPLVRRLVTGAEPESGTETRRSDPAY